MEAPRPAAPADIALLASMNVATLASLCQARVAIIAPGTKLVQPGEAAKPNQIIASNTFGLPLCYIHGAPVFA